MCDNIRVDRIYRKFRNNNIKWTRISQIDKNIFIGGVPFPESNSYEVDKSPHYLLQKYKINYIISITSDHVDWNIPKNIRYIHFVMDDNERVNINNIFDISANFIREAVDNGGRILIHCQAGMSRSVSLVCAYYLKFGLPSPGGRYKVLFRERATLEQIIDFIRSSRNFAMPNRGFLCQLMNYEMDLKRKSLKRSL